MNRLFAKTRQCTPLGVITKDEWSKEINDVYNKDNKNVRVGYYGRIMEIAEDGSKVKMLLTHAMNLDGWNNPTPFLHIDSDALEIEDSYI